MSYSFETEAPAPPPRPRACPFDVREVMNVLEKCLAHKELCP